MRLNVFFRLPYFECWIFFLWVFPPSPLPSLQTSPESSCSLQLSEAPLQSPSNSSQQVLPCQSLSCNKGFIKHMSDWQVHYSLLEFLLLNTQLPRQLVKSLFVVAGHLGGAPQTLVQLLQGDLITHALALHNLDLLEDLISVFGG